MNMNKLSTNTRWNSPIIYSQNFPNLSEDTLLTFTRKIFQTLIYHS